MAMSFLRQSGTFGVRLCISLLIFMGFSFSANLQAQGLPVNGIVGEIYTYAGVGFVGQGPTTLANPRAMTFDKSGNLYVCDAGSFNIKKINSQGAISVYAPNIACTGLAFDSAGDLFATADGCQIVEITPALVVSTVVGASGSCYAVSPGTAATALIGVPFGLAFDTSGNLYISSTPEVANQFPGYILKVGATANGITSSSPVTIIAGSATAGYNGDNQPATQAEFNAPAGIAFDAMGNLYIADSLNFRVRVISPAGIINTIAGNGIIGHTNGSVGVVSAVQWDATTGNVYVSDVGEQVVFRITAAGLTSVYAGTAQGAETPSSPVLNCQNYYATDQVAATIAPLSCPYGVAVDGLGNVYIDDSYAARSRVVIAPPIAPCSIPGNICTIAGNGMAAFAGDGGPATAASLYTPNGLYLDSTNNIFVADSNNNRVRVFTSGGTISTVAGNGTGLNTTNTDSESGDGGPALQATMSYPSALAEDNSGNLYVLDEFECCGSAQSGSLNSDFMSTIRVVSLSNMTISHLLGTSTSSCLFNYYCEGLIPFSVDLAFSPSGAANVAGAGPGLYSSSYYGFGGGFSIEFISSQPSQIGSPSQASLAIASGDVADYLAIDSASNVYFTSTPAVNLASTYSYPDSYTIQMSDPYGNVSTIAGSGSPNYSGDGGPAINAGMTPGALAVDSTGNIFIVDLSVNAVRVVIAPNDPSVPYSGLIFTVAGNPNLAPGFSGDGGPATSAQLNAPGGIKVDSQGNLYISDSANNRVRLVTNPAAGQAWPHAILGPPGGPVLPGSGCTPTLRNPCPGGD